ncbi:DegV family protein [Alkalibacter rhizosphaerae]|uniref:DegV family protein n=1 Tax=Alkalibacter rhizosphaerae TaxID=2815577 RepID=A0A975AI23_9FIRM|nr:DegV family protein [Alkalibacter rhizosphaerae]QSX08229.1 DegV family protein [Alkalibacter rhizosphaerae]
MDQNKIAILTDSCSDVPQSLLERFHIYEMALRINYKDRSYRDRVDISPEEVYENLQKEIPHTSFPTIGEMHETIEKIVADGYDQIIIPVISSGLSGTFKAIKMVCEDFKDIKTKVIDTKNIGLGSGFLSVYAAQLRDQKLNFEEIVEKVENKIATSNIYFSLKTLEYLIKGGRLGRVEGMIGRLLQVKPIITCDTDGIYYTVEKARGRKQSISKLIKIVQDKIKDKKNYYLCICHGYAQEEADKIREMMQPYVDSAALFMEGQISPALGVHTGPGLIGIGCFELDD